ncbi:MAG: tetratricopeptide repeat protein [Candidatus Omnitrophota bacterium]
MKAFFQKIVRSSGWLFSRAGFFYLAVFLAMGMFIDIEKIWGNARIRSMNRIMPLFEDLASNLVAGKSLTFDQWQEYALYYQKISELIPADPGAYFFLGYCLSHLNREEEALSNFEKAVQKAPGVFWFEYNLAMAYYKKADYEKAGEFFRRSIDSGAAAAQFYMRNSTLYKQVLASALRQGFDPETSFNASFAHAHIMTARCLYELGKYDQAIQLAYYHLRRGLGAPQDYYYLIALSLKATGKLTDMMSVLQLLLKHDPDHLGAWQMMREFFIRVQDLENVKRAELKLEYLRKDGPDVDKAVRQQKLM